ncbi:hypothetical protein [Variovorax sp. YR752]|uniref:hypothetical protein n=1 Tax=Variovorax sp. YR752 TaxID=1884383 RepID=UPI0031384952
MGAEEQDTQLMNYLVRMVVPLRREFGRNLNVGQFLHDFSYAREVLAEALNSQDPRLLEYARYVEKRLHGPRIADTPAPPPKPAAPDSKLEAPKAAPAASASEEELRARVLKKYTGGLR